MKKDKQHPSFVNVGSSSLLIIFLVLCLATFAILSLSSARSDYSFSERLADHKTEYYEASARAEIITGQIDDLLSEAAAGTASSDSGLRTDGVAASLYGTAVKALLDGAELEGVPLSCDSTLIVTDYSSAETYYTIKSWKVVSSESWNGDQPLNLMSVTD